MRTVYRNRPEVHEDCWPPVKKSQYINLALLENESMDFRNEFSRYTVRGSVDDIMKNKKKIAYSFIFENIIIGSRILLEGRPGSGKTTLMNKISRDWAQGVILNSLVSLLILVPLPGKSFRGREWNYCKLLRDTARVRWDVAIGLLSLHLAQDESSVRYRTSRCYASRVTKFIHINTTTTYTFHV